MRQGWAEAQDLDNGVVKLVVTTHGGMGRTGSGFLVRLDADHAYIVTAAHVVEGAKETGVVFKTHRLDPPVAATVVGPENWDRRGLALVVLPAAAARAAGASPMPLSSEGQPGTEIELRLIGHPRTVGDWSSLYGRVAAREGKMLKVQAPVNEGSSGGPAMRDREVVGVVVEELAGIAIVAPAVSIRTYLDGQEVVPGLAAGPQPVDAAKSPKGPQPGTATQQPSGSSLLGPAVGLLGPRRGETTPAPAKLTVRSNVTGDVVFIDGQRHGPTRLALDLPPGSHLVRVEKEGYEPFEERVELAAGAEKTVRAVLQRPGPKPGETFRDCPTCPEMVVIPAGPFQMGSPAGEKGRNDNEGPVHPVQIARPFALAKHEVTVGEFKAFVEAAGYRTEAEKGQGCVVWNGTEWADDAKRNWRAPGFTQGNVHPVVCVSWTDANAYLTWLSKQTGQAYRLPSEAEWEYAARAGSTTARFWGEHSNQACNFANVGDKALKRQIFGAVGVDDCDDKFTYTAPVGSYSPNAFGLFDMLGNVWELTEDCWNDSYQGAPSDGSTWAKGDCGRRVLRGGSWMDFFPVIVRSAYRNTYVTEVRDNFTGFRPARTL